MGIEMVSDRRTKIPIRVKGTSINKIVFDEGRKNGIYLRTLGNVVMLVPPLAISKSVLDTLVEKTEKTICIKTQTYIIFTVALYLIIIFVRLHVWFSLFFPQVYQVHFLRLQEAVQALPRCPTYAGIFRFSCPHQRQFC